MASKVHSRYVKATVALSVSASLVLGISACSSSNQAQSDAAQGTKSGFNTSDFDTSVRPQDDLFQYVNGPWLKKTEIPADSSTINNFKVLADEARLNVRSDIEQIIQNNPAEGSNDWKVATVYQDTLDMNRRNELGAQPIQPILQRIQSAKTKSELTQIMAELQNKGLANVVPAYVDSDDKNPTKNILKIDSGGMTLPDKDYYTSANFAKQREAFSKHVPTMFELAGVTDSKTKAKQAIDLERKIAAVQSSSEKNTDFGSRYHPYSVAQLKKETPGFDWDAYFKGSQLTNYNIKKLNVDDPKATKGTAKALNDASLADVKSYLQWQVIHYAASSLSEPLVTEDFNFYEKTLDGVKQQSDLWKSGVKNSQDALGQVTGKNYVANHFSPESKQQVQDMVNTILDQYRAQITTLDWMTPETKKKALEKLDTMAVRIGYPDNWNEQAYDQLTLKPGQLAENLSAASELKAIQDWEKLNKPVDRNDWGTYLPQTVNAMYRPKYNDITFPAGILQAPFFDRESEAAANYGAIGAVIGHEISHSFDTNGAQFDAQGRLNNWWTPKDKAIFNKKTEALAKQYSQYDSRFAPGKKVNGKLTLGENIADNAGLQAAIAAYHRSLGGQAGPVIDDLSADQRIIYSFARNWRGKITRETAIQQLTTDPHSPIDVRANNTPRNLQAFYRALLVGPKDKLWIAPGNRIVIWSNSGT